MQLEEALEKLNLKTSGTKAELISRLQDINTDLLGQVMESSESCGAKLAQGSGENQRENDESSLNNDRVRTQLEVQISALCAQWNAIYLRSRMYMRSRTHI